jgi:hypothetical protein
MALGAAADALHVQKRLPLGPVLGALKRQRWWCLGLLDDGEEGYGFELGSEPIAETRSAKGSEAPSGMGDSLAKSARHVASITHQSIMSALAVVSRRSNPLHRGSSAKIGAGTRFSARRTASNYAPTRRNGTAASSGRRQPSLSH